MIHCTQRLLQEPQQAAPGAQHLLIVVERSKEAPRVVVASTPTSHLRHQMDEYPTTAWLMVQDQTQIICTQIALQKQRLESP